MTNENEDLTEAADLRVSDVREQWVAPRFYCVSANQTELSATDSGGDIVWS